MAHDDSGDDDSEDEDDDSEDEDLDSENEDDRAAPRTVCSWGGSFGVYQSQKKAGEP